MKWKCIIIEDNPAFVKVLESYTSRILELEVVGTYSDSIGAAMSIFKLKPDLIFLDVGISGLSGPEMLETLDEKPKTIVISNHPKDVLDDIGVEIDAFLQKPIKFDQFQDAVKEVMATNLAGS